MWSKSEKTSPNDAGAWPSGLRPRQIIAWVAAVVVCALVLGCTSTVRPKVVEDNQVSFDGTNRNSGVLATVTNAQGSVTGAIITTHARDRYNALIDSYGGYYRPPLQKDAGVCPIPTGAGVSSYLIDAQHLVEFMTMNRWSKQGKAPIPK